MVSKSSEGLHIVIKEQAEIQLPVGLTTPSSSDSLDATSSAQALSSNVVTDATQDVSTSVDTTKDGHKLLMKAMTGPPSPRPRSRKNGGRRRKDDVYPTTKPVPADTSGDIGKAQMNSYQEEKNVEVSISSHVAENQSVVQRTATTVPPQADRTRSFLKPAGGFSSLSPAEIEPLSISSSKTAQNSTSTLPSKNESSSSYSNSSSPVGTGLTSDSTNKTADSDSFISLAKNESTSISVSSTAENSSFVSRTENGSKTGTSSKTPSSTSPMKNESISVSTTMENSAKTSGSTPGPKRKATNRATNSASTETQSTDSSSTNDSSSGGDESSSITTSSSTATASSVSGVNQTETAKGKKDEDSPGKKGKNTAGKNNISMTGKLKRSLVFEYNEIHY